MDTAIVSGAGTVQLVGLAVLVVMAIIIGVRMATGGSKAFASVLPEIAGLLVSIWMVARPNDVMSMLLRFVGGVQTPTLPH